MKLSILIPVYNERYSARECLRRVLAAGLPGGLEREIIIVDDGSTDGTAEILREIAAGEQDDVRLLRHERNQGKGASIRTAVREAEGDILLIQDADLEYSPEDYPALLDPILSGEADAVFGTRFSTHRKRRALLFWHTVANSIVTAFSNFFTDLNLTDMETGFKVVRAPFLKHLPIRCDRFGVEPELTAKLAKQLCRIYEVPVMYMGRGYGEGKKIGAWDGIKALGVIVWFWLVDDLYGDDQLGRSILSSMSKTTRFNRWMAEVLGRHLGHRVLEIGAGIGNLSSELCRRDLYIASDADAYYCGFLSRRFANRPNIRVERLDLSRSEDFEKAGLEVDTVLAANVLEHIEDDREALRNCSRVLAAGGRLVLLVPHLSWLFGSLDEALEHRRRYQLSGLIGLLEEQGFELEEVHDFNRVGTPAWIFNGKLLRRRGFGRLQLKLFDSLVWLFKRVDRFLPWPGQSLVAVARKRASAGAS